MSIKIHYEWCTGFSSAYISWKLLNKSKLVTLYLYPLWTEQVRSWPNILLRWLLFLFAFLFVWLFICICMTLYLCPLWAGGTLSTPDQTFLSISFDPWPSLPIPSSLSSRFNSEVSRISIYQILHRWQISLLFFFLPVFCFSFFHWWNISYFAPWCSFSKIMCLKILCQ